MLRFAGKSEIGGRELNEDCAKIGCFHEMNCFAVCDGLGGHGSGEVASAMAVERFLHHFGTHPDTGRENIAEAFEIAQAELLETQREVGDASALKTTAALLLTDAEKAVWAHVGDSRVYLFRKNRIVSRTLDHSVTQLRVAGGELRDKDIRTSPDRNRLLRVLGQPWEALKYEIADPVPLADCQAALLCTDGFWEYLEDRDLCTALRKSRSPEEWLERTFDLVRKRAKRDADNRTAIAVLF